MEKKSITEDDKEIVEGWFKEARAMTAEALPAFVKKLIEDYQHDYGTIVMAETAAALAGLYAVEHSPTGGITGFQAGCLQWEFIRRWGVWPEGPKKVLIYENMLYPQYDHSFEKTIDQETADWLKEQAQKKLDEKLDPHPHVKAHWERLAAGELPFGYTISERD